ncbi:alpha/beta fold hydrolase [Corynebacterium aquilae]|uniref:alpha/beta fold hydrolase n=1 Tax=Corynebacterium aquilae TaxID=203263 RepID=UPI000952B548|nr:alpha/beta fold hydrolase [Corynebacterium aquilae]
MANIEPIRPSDVAHPGPFRHDLIHVRGLRLHVAHTGQPTNPLILLLHDWPGAWFDYFWLLEPLAQHGYHVAALDNRGVGLSDKPPSGYDTIVAAGDVASIIRALGHDDAILVGAGSGGTIAWATAARYPINIRAIVSICGTWPGLVNTLAWRHPFAASGQLLARAISHFPPLAARALRRRPMALSRWITTRAAATPLSGQPLHHLDTIAHWRGLHARVDRVPEKLARWAKIPTERLPRRWATHPIPAPALCIDDGTAWWAHACDASSNYTTSHHRASCAGRLPYITAPEDLADTIADFAQGLTTPR